MKLYIDTNVIIDAVEGRKNEFGRDTGNLAFKLFNDAISCKHYVIISSFTLYELRKRCNADTTMFFEMIKKKRIHAEHDEADEEKARQLHKDNFDDALHVVIAEKEKADYIVTRDEHFKDIETTIPITKPENLI